MTSPSGSRSNPPSADQLSLIDGAGVRPPAPFDLGVRRLYPCDTPGPYHRRVFTERGSHWQVLYCNRPVNHDGNHMWADANYGVAHAWSRDGQPIHTPQSPEAA